MAHTVEGLAQLTTFLLDIVGTPEWQEKLACIIETSHGLLIAALLESGFPVYPVNPKTVDRHRQPAGAKTDAIDAYLLARTRRSDFADLRRLRPESALIQELKTLTRDQESLIASQTRLVHQLTACLKTSYPVALTLFEPAPAAFQRSLSSKPTRPLKLRHKPPGKTCSCCSSRQSIGAWPSARQRMWEQLQQPSDAAGCHHHAGQVTLDAGAGSAPPPAG